MTHTKCTCFPSVNLTSLKALTIIWVTWFTESHPTQEKKEILHVHTD